MIVLSLLRIYSIWSCRAVRARGVKGLVAVHYPAGGYTRPAEAKILVGRASPDVLLWHAGKSFAVELKSATGRVSAAQTEMLDRLSRAGVVTVVCRGVDQAVVSRIVETVAGCGAVGPAGCFPSASQGKTWEASHARNAPYLFVFCTLEGA
jgi:hypothetical protein